MKHVFYPKLAWTGIQKNKRLYIPYILTCIGMVMMFYIVAFLCTSSIFASVPGGEVVQSMLGFGRWVITAFSLLFLFYTNSFLAKRRKKEFGLYNILGMGKRNLARILVWESLIISGISLCGGLLAGIVFSKFAELGMVNILQAEITFSMSINTDAVMETLRRFVIIFILILLHTLWQIRKTNPIELLHSEHAGEKPPKANWILALAGALLVGTAYYLAITIVNPIEAIVVFFGAVILVIVGTYLLFIAGSVTICRILQKKKGYYYKTNHFVSVSSMVYRMKRNGAGLASICILSTMVLVMLSGTVCLYAGTEDSLRTRYPRNINLDAAVPDVDALESSDIEEVKNQIDQLLKENSQKAENILDYRMLDVAGYIRDGRIETDISKESGYQAGSYSEIWQIFMVPLEDYNRTMKEEETLASDEVLIYTTKTTYEGNTISVDDRAEFQIKKVVKEFVDNGVDAMQVIPSMYIFVPDLKETSRILLDQTEDAENIGPGVHWNYGFDLDCKDEIQEQIQSQIEQLFAEGYGDFTFSIEGVARERSGFYGLYGGLFFLGILLGVVFIFAAVLIIYYKQISEGYEDQSRFEIMQKVGMTQKEIRRSINSQVLTVFFLPLITAGVHLIFAFPMVYRLLVLFSLTNLKLLIVVTLGCYLLFALFYVLVYRGTSRAYYHIVSSELT